MSKSMMAAAGGGKVTVEGLDAEAVFAGNTVAVMQGSKVVRQVEGELDVLAVMAASSSGTIALGASMYWNGADMVSSAGTSFSYSGEPLFAYAAVEGYATLKVGGVSISSGIKTITNFPSNAVSYANAGGAYQYGRVAIVVLGKRK